MSPVPVDEEMDNLDFQLEYKLQIIENLQKEEQMEITTLSSIMDTKDRQASRSRKRKRSNCIGCRPSFKNSCLDCKQEFASKKLKKIHDEQEALQQEITDLKAKQTSHQEVRALRRPAEIWEEARRKEYEAAQLDADELKQEAINDDYPQFPNRSTDGEEMQDEDVKMEPYDPIGSIGMPNQIKTEPLADDSPLVNNDVFMNDAADSTLSTSDEDMDAEPANDAQEAPNNNAPLNEAPNNADNELPWWFPYNDELDAYINSF